MNGPLPSLSLLCAAGIASGLAVAWRAQGQRTGRARFEMAAGLLLTGGLFLVGLGLPVFR